MRVDMSNMEDESFVGDWARVTAKHMPWLQHRFRLQLSMQEAKDKADENDGKCVVITLPPADQSVEDWELSLVGMCVSAAMAAQSPAAAWVVPERTAAATTTTASAPVDVASINLWQSAYSCADLGPWDIRVLVNQHDKDNFSGDDHGAMLRKAWAYQRAPSGTAWHDSPPTLSAWNLPILPSSSNLKLSLSGRAIRASWRSSPILPNDRYIVKLTTAGG